MPAAHSFKNVLSCVVAVIIVVPAFLLSYPLSMESQTRVSKRAPREF